MTHRVVVLGSTGSIGTQTLEVVSNLGYEVSALAARSPSDLLAVQANAFPDAVVVVAEGSVEERENFEKALGRTVLYGSDSVLQVAARPDTIVINGIVGAVGLRATLAALEAGNRVGLANKESLVAGGPVVKALLKGGSGELIPVDSEHSALFQCLVGEDIAQVARLVLTASGGPFRGWNRQALRTVTAEQALQHPTWEMGRRITIDSATLFNKGLEVIEAHYLFDVSYDRIDVVVHPQSVLHSVVEFVDGSWKGHLGHADMRVPIQYAITAPARAAGLVQPFDLAGRTLDFEEPDHEAFPALGIAYRAGRRGGSAPAVLNAADEVGVEAFLQGRLGFLGIAMLVEQTLSAVDWRELSTFNDVVAADSEARLAAESLVAGIDKSLE